MRISIVSWIGKLGGFMIVVPVAIAAAIPGDLNLDRVVNLADIEPFTLATVDNARWRSIYEQPQSELIARGDFNSDGKVDARDADGFQAAVALHLALQNAGSGRGTPRAVGGRGFTPGVPVDLDIDSDNNRGTQRPNRDETEDAAEDGTPGKLLLVNDDDDDNNTLSDLTQNGVLAAERDDLVPLVLELPGDATTQNVTYRLTFPTNVRVWKAATRGSTAGGSPDFVPSGTNQVFSVAPRGDMDCNSFLTVGDIGCFVKAVSNVNDYNATCLPCDIMRADMNDDGFVTVGDIGLFVDGLAPSGPTEFMPLNLWVEGLSKNTAAGGTTITANVDLTGDGDFDDAGEADSVRATVTQLTISPSTGGLGTPLSLSFDPSVAPWQYGTTTTAGWSGFYDAATGPDSTPFTVAFNAAQFRETSGSQATILLGDGTVAGTIPFATLSSIGSLRGHIATMFDGSSSATRSFSLQPTTLSARLEALTYSVAPGQLPLPQLAGPFTTQLPLMPLSRFSDPMNPRADILFYGSLFHVAAVLRIAQNAQTSGSISPSYTVTVQSYSPSGMVVDQIDSLVLSRILGDDGDPTSYVYVNDLTRPILLVDTDINAGAYPAIIPLFALENGTIRIVPTPN